MKLAAALAFAYCLRTHRQKRALRSKSDEAITCITRLIQTKPLSRASARALSLKRSRRSTVLAHYVLQLCLVARSAHTKTSSIPLSHQLLYLSIYRFIHSLLFILLAIRAVFPEYSKNSRMHDRPFEKPKWAKAAMRECPRKAFERSGMITCVLPAASRNSTHNAGSK